MIARYFRLLSCLKFQISLLPVWDMNPTYGQKTGGLLAIHRYDRKSPTNHFFRRTKPARMTKLNALFHRSLIQRTITLVVAVFALNFNSIAASTAVFGAWGLLTGCGIYNAFRLPSHEPWAQVIIPLGGGIALLSWTGLGGGDLSVDVLGHLGGFLFGGILGAITASLKLRRL